MHRFWQPAFSVLHDCVLDYLSEPTVHEILPLLRLNRHLRKLVLEKLVRVFRHVPTVDKSWSFIKIRACSRAEDDGGDGPTTATADPRHMFFPEQSVVVEFFGGGGDGEVPENQADPEDGSTIMLYMTHHDPTTHLCTFEALPDHDGIGFFLPTIEDIGRYNEMCGSGPAVFQAASNYWFRPALDGKNSVSGLQLAARPDLQPSRTPALAPEVSDEPGGTLEETEYRCANGWIAHYLIKRYDEEDDILGEKGMATTIFTLKSLRVPLLDLFIPPTTAKDDLTGAFERYPLERYLKEQYEEEGHWEDIEQEFALMQDRFGIV
ncbi:hypothetical protein JCM10450v2_002188 [Rhodotorula kratochvilovae]